MSGKLGGAVVVGDPDARRPHGVERAFRHLREDRACDQRGVDARNTRGDRGGRGPGGARLGQGRLDRAGLERRERAGVDR